MRFSNPFPENQDINVKMVLPPVDQVQKFEKQEMVSNKVASRELEKKMCICVK